MSSDGHSALNRLDMVSSKAINVNRSHKHPPLIWPYLLAT